MRLAVSPLLIVLVLFSGELFAQTPPDTLKVPFTQDFELNGSGSESQWQQVKWAPMPHREGARKYSTQVKILYSSSGIYCLFLCQDAKIISTMKEDFSDLWKEDVVEAFFWTDQSAPLYFEYELSPSNVELAILVPNFSGTFLGWRPWHYEGGRKTRHAVQQTTRSWTAEFFIPYALLKPLQNVPPKKGTTWRCNFYRIDYDEGVSEWSWQLTRTNFHEINSFGVMLFD